MSLETTSVNTPSTTILLENFIINSTDQDTNPVSESTAARLPVINATIASQIEFDGAVNPSVVDLCEDLVPPMDDLTQEQFTSKLTDACRYDKLIKPPTVQPLPVYMQMDLRHIEASDQLQFKAHMLVQYLYKDNRLIFEHLSPRRGNILGEELLRNKIWVPHMTIMNEKDTTIMGIDGKDVFVSISPTGDVVYSYRMTATFYCWMNLQKFPFDSQECFIRWNSCKLLTEKIASLVVIQHCFRDLQLLQPDPSMVQQKSD